ncbi:hypothetical protein ACLKA7_006364 [Drosophila subpalustris]
MRIILTKSNYRFYRSKLALFGCGEIRCSRQKDEEDEDEDVLPTRRQVQAVQLTVPCPSPPCLTLLRSLSLAVPSCPAACEETHDVALMRR